MPFWVPLAIGKLLHVVSRNPFVAFFGAFGGNCMLLKPLWVHLCDSGRALGRLWALLASAVVHFDASGFYFGCILVLLGLI